MIKAFEKYTDAYLMLKGFREDEGDSIHRTMMYYLGIKWLTDSFHHLPWQILNKLECPDKLYRRHPSKGWWSDCDRCSRDQSVPLVIALSEFNYKPYLHRFFKNHLKRFFFFTNTRRNGATQENHGERKWFGHESNFTKYDYSWKPGDFITPKFMAIYLRCFDAWYLCPLLYLLDLELVVRTLMLNNNEDTDVLNHLISCHYGVRKFPTILSRLAFRLIDETIFNRKMTLYFQRVGMLEMYSLWGFK